MPDKSHSYLPESIMREVKSAQYKDIPIIQNTNIRTPALIGKGVQHPLLGGTIENDPIAKRLNGTSSIPSGRMMEGMKGGRKRSMNGAGGGPVLRVDETNVESEHPALPGSVEGKPHTHKPYNHNLTPMHSHLNNEDIAKASSFLEAPVIAPIPRRNSTAIADTLEPPKSPCAYSRRSTPLHHSRAVTPQHPSRPETPNKVKTPKPVSNAFLHENMRNKLGFLLQHNTDKNISSDLSFIFDVLGPEDVELLRNGSGKAYVPIKFPDLKSKVEKILNSDILEDTEVDNEEQDYLERMRMEEDKNQVPDKAKQKQMQEGKNGHGYEDVLRRPQKVDLKQVSRDNELPIHPVGNLQLEYRMATPMVDPYEVIS
jgi:hypothetical protein